MLHHGLEGASSEYNKRNLTLTLTLNLQLLLHSIVFHNKICVFFMIFTTLSILRLIYYTRRQCQLDYMLYICNKISIRKPLVDISHIQLFWFPFNASPKQNIDLTEVFHVKPPSRFLIFATRKKQTNKQTLWPLFMDGVQLSQG